MDQANVELAVVEVFREVLDAPALTVDDDFFAAGGDSLLAVLAVNRLGEVLGSSVDPMVVFMWPTAAGSAAALTDQDPT